MFNDNKESVIRTFDASAEKFDEIGTPFFKSFGKSLANFSEIRQGDIVLDIACGKGSASFPMLETLNGSGKLMAIDISFKMIGECQKKINTIAFTNIEFIVMDAEDLQFADNTFDKVVCGFGLFFLPDIEKGLSEIRRVLKPNGLLTFSSWNNDYQLKWYNEIISKYIPELLFKKETSEEKIAEQDFRTVDGIEKILKLSSFLKVQIVTENIDCLYNHAEEWIETRWHTAHRMLFEQLDAEQYKHLLEELRDQIQHYKEDNKIKITMSAFLTKAMVSKS
jgi:ubiquinone/menaquinone biosynthesis C-methylase UbiE